MPGHERSGALRAALLLLLIAVPASAQEARTLSLEEALRLAVQRDPAAVAAEAALTNARAEQLTSRGAFLPSITLNSSFSNSSNERFDQNSGRLVSESYQAQAQGSYELFAFGRRLANLRAAGAQVSAADAQYEAQRFATVLRTTEIFYATAAAADIASAAAQRLERARQQLTVAQTRLELGTVTQSDILRAAGAQVSAADAQYEAQRFATVLRTTEIFYATAAAADIASAAQQRLERARQQLTVAQTRMELGTVTQSDILRAELELGNAELAVLDAQAALRNTSLELGRQVGLAEAVATAPAALPERAPSLPDTETLIAMAEGSSPAVTAAEMTLRSRRAERLASYTPYLPTLRITGGYDWFSFDFPPRDQSWSLRLLASLPVFNGFQRESAVQRAAAAERLAQARARDARIGARVSVESAVADIASAEQRVRIAARAVGLAREDLRVIEERYGIGMVTILELQASQVALSDAEVAAVRARQTLGTAVARLESILGRNITEGVTP